VEGVVGTDELKAAAQKMALKAEDDSVRAAHAAAEDEEEGEDLCNCEFSLAYGAKILLNNAKLRLKRGKRYGLCGPNGAGKSTLMRAIANGQVEGFPPPTELKTVYVEHDIDATTAELTPLEFIFTDPTFKGIPKEDVSTSSWHCALQLVTVQGHCAGLYSQHHCGHCMSTQPSWRCPASLAYRALHSWCAHSI
jgi:hypothetical protein